MRLATAAGFVIVAFLAGCGNETEGPPTAEPQSPTTEASTYEPPELDTVPLAKATKGDLIALPAYPEAAVYAGTADVRGMKSFRMKIPLTNNLHAFGPSVLIGSPGQQITLTDFADRAASPIEPHDFRISDGPDPSDDVVGKQWEAAEGTSFQITFPQEGSVAFYCSYHVRTKMAGMLVVRD